MDINGIIKSIEAAENSIIDVNLEYKCKIEPPHTFDDCIENVCRPKPKPYYGGIPEDIKCLITKNGITKHKMYASGFESKPRKPRPAFEGPKMWLMETKATLMLTEDKGWDNVLIETYDGSSYKRLSIGGWPKKVRDGYISNKDESRPLFTLSPLGFSVFRMGLCEIFDKTPLSAILKEEKFAAFEPEVKNINGFNTVSVAFLQEYTRNPVARVYFSIDHNLTPVRFDYLNGAKSEKSKADLTFDVLSLQKVDENLWFPGSGVIRDCDEDRVNVFEVTKPVSLNKGLAKSNFQFDFPKNTRVHNKTENKDYVVN